MMLQLYPDAGVSVALITHEVRRLLSVSELGESELLSTGLHLPEPQIEWERMKLMHCELRVKGTHQCMYRFFSSLTLSTGFLALYMSEYQGLACLMY